MFGIDVKVKINDQEWDGFYAEAPGEWTWDEIKTAALEQARTMFVSVADVEVDEFDLYGEHAYDLTQIGA